MVSHANLPKEPKKDPHHEAVRASLIMWTSITDGPVILLIGNIGTRTSPGGPFRFFSGGGGGR